MPRTNKEFYADLIGGGVTPEDAKEVISLMGGEKSKTSTSLYGNKKTEYNGWTYDSKMESNRAATLDLLVKAGKVVWWLPQVPFYLGSRVNRYTVDFVVAEYDSSGSAYYVHAEDTKGSDNQRSSKNFRLWVEFGKFPLHVIYKSETKIYVPKGL